MRDQSSHMSFHAIASASICLARVPFMIGKIFNVTRDWSYYEYFHTICSSDQSAKLYNFGFPLTSSLANPSLISSDMPFEAGLLSFLFTNTWV